ncbi:MAG: hypothetical protein NT007_01995 [Candidatus Kapabacteria bacterium]|nr:hypothetical protein [Candidatus Kapabacteria bacterium]
MISGTRPTECPETCYWTLWGNSNTNPTNYLGTTNPVPLFIGTNNQRNIKISENGHIGIWYDGDIGTTGNLMPYANPLRVGRTTLNGMGFLSNAYLHNSGFLRPIRNGLPSLFMDFTSGGTYAGFYIGLDIKWDFDANKNLFEGICDACTPLPSKIKGIRFFQNNDYSNVNIGIGDWSPESKFSILVDDDDESKTAFSVANIVGNTKKSIISVHDNGNVGIGTSTPDVLLHVKNGVVKFDGIPQSNSMNWPSGSDNRFMWLPDKGSIITGSCYPVDWINLKTGYYSVILGQNQNVASDWSLVAGYNNSISGIGNSSAFCDMILGNNNSIIWNNSNLICQQSIIIGDYSTITNSWGSTSIGRMNSINDGLENQIFGCRNTVNGMRNYVIGENNTLNCNRGFAFGYNNNINHDGSCLITDANDSYNHIWNESTCSNQLTMRFTGGSYLYPSYRFITGLGYINGRKKYGLFLYQNNSIGMGLTNIFSEHSVALGSHVETQTDHDGSFVFGDASLLFSPLSKPYTKSTSKNQMTMRFTGDLYSPNIPSYKLIWNSIGTEEVGLFLFRNANGIEIKSDSNLKEDKHYINNEQTLITLQTIPLYNWRWKYSTYTIDSVTSITDSCNYRWLGPMAQDFYNAFPLGIPDNTLLSTSIIDGVCLASIQALGTRTDTLNNQMNNVWYMTGNSSTVTNKFLGTTIANSPLSLRTNSAERVKIEDNRITMQFHGNESDTSLAHAAYRFYTNDYLTTGIFLASGESGWRYISDRYKKENFDVIDNESVLKSISRIPLSSWTYKNASSNIRYVGPMAQDFYKEFKLGGTDSLSINSQVMEGVSFAAIQGLIARTESLSTLKDSLNCLQKACDRIYLLIKENAELQLRLSSLEEKINHLSQNNTVDCYSDIILEQNQPNPFDNTTIINYFIPSHYVGTIEFVVTDNQGTSTMETKVVVLDKPTSLTITTNSYNTGVYLYGIRINGKIIKSKKMMIVK